MAELPPLFASEAAFEQAFVDGLGRMLEHPAAGSFILALANASFESGLYQLLRPRLLTAFEALSGQTREQLAAGRNPAAAPDDLLVLLKLMAVGIERLPSTESRRAGPFELQYNLLRSFRPARMAGSAVSGMRRPFDANGFHFNKPFLRDEILWAGELDGMALRLLYNKFPFVRLHGLLLIEPEACREQFLDADSHQRVWVICQRIGSALPGFGLGYNSFGAFASVNHQHFQSYLRDQPLPVESGRWAHNGGAQDYPLPVSRFDDVDAAWQAIERLHRRDQPYNLLYRPGRCYLITRQPQGRAETPHWAPGPAWSELCGLVNLTDAECYAALCEDDCRRMLANLRPDALSISER